MAPTGKHVQIFSLIPYPANDLPTIDITGEITREKNQLSIHYEVRGDIDQIILPPPSVSPARKDDLWKATCFEFFLAIPNHSQYWEFNMSPSGDWNVYIMDAYRRVGFREEKAIPQLPFEFRKENSKLFLNLSVDLSPIIALGIGLQIAITAIIQTKDGNETYWALAHTGQQADFHLRESFIVSL
jgi:hypothetical protein